MYAVIETGGKQYRVQEGDVISIEKLNAVADEKIEFDKVLVLNDDKTVQVGTPYVDAVKVFGTVVENGKGDKVIIFKYKAKKDYRKKQGHRQPYTMVKIDSLNGLLASKKAAPKEAKAEVAKEEKTEGIQETKAKVPSKKPKSEASAKEETVKKVAVAKKPAAKKATNTEDIKEV